MIYSHHYVGIPVQSGVMRMNSHILRSVWKPVMMVLQCCCEADPWVCFHAEINPDDHHRFLHIPRRYEFRPSMIQAHGEAFCRFHPAYGASCSFHKKHPAVLQKHCTVEVFPPGNPSDQDPVVLFSSLYALLGELLPQKAPFLIHRRQPPLHQKMKADLRLTLRSLYVCQICNCWQCEPAQ